VSELARALIGVLGIVLGVAFGWFGRGWYDGSTISTADSQAQSQEFVTAGTQAAIAIESAEGKAEAARVVVRERTRYVEVKGDCPAGLGAVSDDVRKRLQLAFGES
jgi:hypothetical protein